MPSRTLSRTIWTAIETVSAGSAVGVFLYYMGLDEQFMHTRPTVANPSTGRIYSLNNHGFVVYLTSAEQKRLHILALMAAFFFLIAVLIGVFIETSWRNPKPWETRR